MARKPKIAAEYLPGTRELAIATSIYIATKLGDFRDDFVIVGGLVPGLIIPQANKPQHIGTMDVDLGLAVAIVDEERYHELGKRLRSAGFAPGENEEGRKTTHRWQINVRGRQVTVDFLIPETLEGDTGKSFHTLERDLAAFITPGLELAFTDRRPVTLSGKTLFGEQAIREVWVCDAGAFTVLKALAFRGRGENKDAYDLIYVLQNYGAGVVNVSERLRPLLTSSSTQRALAILEEDFAGVDSVGIMRFAEFMGNPEGDAIRADAAGAVRALLRLCGRL